MRNTQKTNAIFPHFKHIKWSIVYIGFGFWLSFGTTFTFLTSSSLALARIVINAAKPLIEHHIIAWTASHKTSLLWLQQLEKNSNKNCSGQKSSQCNLMKSSVRIWFNVKCRKQYFIVSIAAHRCLAKMCYIETLIHFIILNGYLSRAFVIRKFNFWLLTILLFVRLSHRDSLNWR